MLLGRTPTADEDNYMKAVVNIGCIICRLYLDVESPAEIHHVDGKTKTGCHFKILPLCPPHHRLSGHSYISRANGKKAFEAAYMPEADLIIVVQEAVKLQEHRTIRAVRGK